MADRPAKPKRMRLDELLVVRELAPTRAQAQLLIRAGKVRTGTQTLDKPGKTVASDLDLTILQLPRFVGRGGEKLDGFLEAHPLDVSGCTFLDVGASTGGFTDCLLQRGAGPATCVDVGHGQLHHKLRIDPRVTNLERVNARELDPEQLPRASYPLIVMDLSFISLRKVLPSVWPLLESEGHLIALVKPQFEATKAEADATRGVIRDNNIRERILSEVLSFVQSECTGSEEVARQESSIAGADGNREYLVHWKRQS